MGSTDILKETETKSGWQIDATGDDIKKLKGMLVPTGNEAYKKAFHEKVEPEWKQRQEEFCPMNRPRTICPALPWQSDRLPGETWSAYVKRTGKAEGS